MLTLSDDTTWTRAAATDAFLYFQDADGLVCTTRLDALCRALGAGRLATSVRDWSRYNDTIGRVTLEGFLSILESTATYGDDGSSDDGEEEVEDDASDAMAPQSILDAVERIASRDVSSEDVKRLVSETAFKSSALGGYPLPPIGIDAYTVRADAADPESVAAAASCFRSMGLVVVKELLAADTVARAFAQATGSLQKLLAAIEARGAAFGVGTQCGFAEIVRRTPKRYEMNYEMRGHGVFAESSVRSNPWLSRLVPLLMRGDVANIAPVAPTAAGATPATQTCAASRHSLLISLPGAGVQEWHIDGGHIGGKQDMLPAHAVNVFVALTDVTLEMGPTELYPASHFLTRMMAKSMLLAKVQHTLHASVTPTLRAGDAVVFDYRVLHRGTANESDRPRAMLELVYTREGWCDTINFPQRSVFS